MHFGEHLTIDGYGGDKDKLNNESLVMQCLRELPGKLGMKILMAPQIVHAPDNDKKDPGGWTGFVIIAESHISIHTFPNRGFVSIDVYSCRNGMDTALVLKYSKEKFDLKDIAQGRVTSNRVTWGVWMLVQILFVISYYQSVGLVTSIWVPIVYLFGTVLIFISLLKYSGKGSWSWIEKIALISVIIISAIWFITESSLVALTLTLIIDTIGAIPLVMTVWRDPNADYAPAWYLGFISNALNLFAIEKWDYANAVYPIYLTVMTFTVASILKFRQYEHDS